MKKNIINIILTLIFMLVYYYFLIPPINLQSSEFYSFVILTLLFYLFVSSLNLIISPRKVNVNVILKNKVIVFIIVGIICLELVINFIFSPIFQADSYSKRIDINTNGDFVNDISEVDFNKLPLLDKDSSSKLGDRVMGQMPEMVSQYYVSNTYTQINYNDTILRVTPLEYNGLFKFFKNKDKGVIGYITVNSVNGESNLVKLDKGMKYMPSAYFGKDLYRHLRFKYPTLIFGSENFEIDNEGNPYFIIPYLKFTAIGLKREVKGVVILDPITGESKKYDVSDVPSWVDHVYDADLIIEQVDDWGSYQNGFLNSVFSQSNVVMTTDGYNYLVMDDDVYLYTGITSVSSDEANVGFILTNMRTKETNFYQVPGAEEYSAMASAEGQVQQMKYISTFPLLINLNNKPTYLMSLKDNAGLVKMYAFVDVSDYQKVVVTDASLGIETASQNYLDGSETYINEDTLNKEIIVKNITSAVIDGTTYYYIEDINNSKYKVSIKVNRDLIPFIKINDKINIYYKTESEVIDIIKIETV